MSQKLAEYYSQFRIPEPRLERSDDLKTHMVRLIGDLGVTESSVLRTELYATRTDLGQVMDENKTLMAKPESAEAVKLLSDNTKLKKENERLELENERLKRENAKLAHENKDSRLEFGRMEVKRVCREADLKDAHKEEQTRAILAAKEELLEENRLLKARATRAEALLTDARAVLDECKTTLFP